MGRPLRKTVIPHDEVGYYHIYNRCVRGAFLIGTRDRRGSARDPRKDSIQARLAYLCQGFAVEVCDFSAMDNHFHLILRNRPDLVSHYSDEEVARRGWHLRPLQKDARTDVIGDCYLQETETQLLLLPSRLHHRPTPQPPRPEFASRLTRPEQTAV